MDSARVTCVLRENVGSDHYAVLGLSDLSSLLGQIRPQREDGANPDPRAVVCELFHAGEVETERAVAKQACAVGQASFPATTDGLDGNWHILRFPGERFVTMYEPPERNQVYPPTSWTIRREGSLAVHEVVEPAYVCPNSPEEVCVAWSPREEDTPTDEAGPPNPKKFFCPDAEARQCEQHGFNVESFVVNPQTEERVRLGPISRGAIPRITAGREPGAFTVDMPDCGEEMSFASPVRAFDKSLGVREGVTQYLGKRVLVRVGRWSPLFSFRVMNPYGFPRANVHWAEERHEVWTS